MGNQRPKTMQLLSDSTIDSGYNELGYIERQIIRTPFKMPITAMHYFRDATNLFI